MDYGCGRDTPLSTRTMVTVAWPQSSHVSESEQDDFLTLFDELPNDDDILANLYRQFEMVELFKTTACADVKLCSLRGVCNCFTDV